MSAFQLKERKERTIFVGNLPLETSKKELKKRFKDCGEIENIWFRSIPVDNNSKLPLRAKIILGQHGSEKDNKNGYILFKTKDAAKSAAE